VGFVPDENIVGKAFFIWFNFSEAAALRNHFSEGDHEEPARHYLIGMVVAVRRRRYRRDRGPERSLLPTSIFQDQKAITGIAQTTASTVGEGRPGVRSPAAWTT